MLLLENEDYKVNRAMEDFSEKGKKFPFMDVEVDPINRPDIPEILAYLLNLYDGFFTRAPVHHCPFSL